MDFGGSTDVEGSEGTDETSSNSEPSHVAMNGDNVPSMIFSESYQPNASERSILSHRNDQAEAVLSPVLQKNRSGKSALHLVAASGSIKGLELMLQHGANINEQDAEGQTALHIAITAMHDRWEELVMHLLDAGADPNLANNVGSTPLHLAAERGLDNCVRALLTNGATSISNHAGDLPLHLAALGGHASTMQLLFPWRPGASEEVLTGQVVRRSQSDLTLTMNAQAPLLLGEGIDPPLEGSEEYCGTSTPMERNRDDSLRPTLNPQTRVAHDVGYLSYSSDSDVEPPSVFTPGAWDKYLTVNGDVYYFHSNSGASSWDVPFGNGVWIEGALGEGALGEGALGEGALGEGALGDPQSWQGIGESEEWEVESPDYVSSGFEEVAVAHEQHPFNASDAYSLNPVAASDWVEYTDDAGYPYWHNQITDQSTYECPTAGASWEGPETAEQVEGLGLASPADSPVNHDEWAADMSAQNRSISTAAADIGASSDEHSRPEEGRSLEVWNRFFENAITSRQDQLPPGPYTAACTFPAFPDALFQSSPHVFRLPFFSNK
jgi:hypothetical protein